MTAGGQKDKKTERKKKDNAEFGWQSLNEGSFIWMHIDSKPTDALSIFGGLKDDRKNLLMRIYEDFLRDMVQGNVFLRADLAN